MNDQHWLSYSLPLVCNLYGYIQSNYQMFYYVSPSQFIDWCYANSLPDYVPELDEKNLEGLPAFLSRDPLSPPAPQEDETMDQYIEDVFGLSSQRHFRQLEAIQSHIDARDNPYFLFHCTISKISGLFLDSIDPGRKLLLSDPIKEEDGYLSSDDESLALST